jgi:hypothetical protein
MSKARDLANIISGSGTLNANVIPDLPTSKITSGTFADARISASSVNAHVDLTSLSASNLTSGTVPSARLSLAESDVPNLSASKVTSGSFDTARIPNLSAAKITSGTMDGSRISGGTFGSVNGSALTSLPSSAPTNAQILTGVASASLNSVGSYSMVRRQQDINPGSTYSGGGMTFTAASGSQGNNFYTVPAGTWRTMGAVKNTNNVGEACTVWLRIS